MFNQPEYQEPALQSAKRIHQTMPTSGNDLAPDQVNYLSKMKKWIMDNAGEANSAMEERDGAESAMESKNSAGDLIADVDNGGRECNEVKDLVPDTGKCAKFGSPKLAYLQSRVKSASSKKGVLIVEDEKSVITTPTSPFTGVIMTAKANMKKTRMTKVDNNAKFKHFQVVLSGYKSTDMMVRLPYDRNATFQNLRRELMEGYDDDFSSSDFRFTLTANGVAVNPMQEEKLEGARLRFDESRRRRDFQESTSRLYEEYQEGENYEKLNVRRIEDL